jgi:hypothetical protein
MLTKIGIWFLPPATPLADFIYRNQYGQKLAHQSASEEI